MNRRTRLAGEISLLATGPGAQDTQKQIAVSAAMAKGRF